MTREQRGVRRTLIAGIAFAVNFLFAVYMSAMGVVLPTLGAAFGLGTSVQGRLFPASFSGSVSGVLLCGWLSDRFGRKPVLLSCLAVGTMGYLVFGTAGAFPAILLAALLIGAGGAAGQTVCGALLTDLFPERRAAFLNGTQVAFGVGAMVGPALMQRLIAAESGTGAWRMFYFALAGIHAALLLLMAFQFVPKRTASASERERNAASTGPLWRNRVLLLLCLSAFLYSGAEVAMFSWMPTYLQTLPDGVRWAGMIVSVFWAAMTVGRVTTGLLIGRMSLARLRFLLALSATIVGSLTLLLPSPTLLVVGVGLRICVKTLSLGYTLVHGATLRQRFDG